MGEARPAKTSLRCPKCRSRTLVLSEVSEAIYTVEVNGGLLDLRSGFTEQGEITRYFAQCQTCAHCWKPRAAQPFEEVDALPTTTGQGSGG